MLKINKVEIENFQSHEYTVVEFADGLNVIIGPSDQGKTAIIRAIRWVLHNEPRGTDFIRVGANSCRVSLFLSDGSVIIRERSASRNRYILQSPDGKEEIYEGFGTNIPPEIHKAHRMGKISLDSDYEVSLNIGQQLEGAFMLSSTGSLRAKILGRLTGVQVVDVALRELVSDLARYNQEEKRIEMSLSEIEKGLGDFEDLDVIEKIISRGRQITRDVSHKEDLLKELRKINETLKANKAEIQVVENYLERLSVVGRIESSLENAIKCKNNLDRYRILNQQMHSIQFEERKFNVVISETANVFKIENVLNNLKESLQALSKFSKVLQKGRTIKLEAGTQYEILKQLKDTNVVEELTKQAEVNKERLATLRRKHVGLKQVISEIEDSRYILKIAAKVEKTENLTCEKLPKLQEKLEKLALLSEKKIILQEQIMKGEKFIQSLALSDGVNDLQARLFELYERQQKLRQYKLSLDSLQKEQVDAKDYLEQLVGKIAYSTTKFRKVLRATEKCPYCLSKISEEHIEEILSEIGLEGGRHGSKL